MWLAALALSLTLGAPRAGAVTVTVPAKVRAGAAHKVAVFVTLDKPSAAAVFARPSEGRPSPGRAGRAAKAAALRAAREQRSVAPKLERAAPGSTELYRVSAVLNGIARMVRPADIDRLEDVPGVASVSAIAPESALSSSAVSFLQIPSLWTGSGTGLTGTGVRVGVIDSGIDYLHAHFGGDGLSADYSANDPAAAPDAYFPTACVAGGTDFAGDGYDGTNAPSPDPDPMDCMGTAATWPAPPPAAA